MSLLPDPVGAPLRRREASTRTRSSSRPPYQGVRSRWPSRRSATRSPSATDLATWLAARTGAERGRGRRGQHPGAVGLLERDAPLRGDLGRRGAPARDPGRAHRPHRLPGHRLRHAGAGDAGAAAPRARSRCRRCSGSRRTRRSSAPASCACAGSTGEVPGRQPRLPRRGLDAGAARRTAQRRCGRAASTRWPASTSSTAPRSGSAGSRDVTPDEQLDLDREYRTFACGDVPYPAVDRAFEILEATVPPRDRPARALLGRLAHRQHDLRRRPARRRGARLGDGHGRRSRAGPRVVPAARPPPRDGLRHDAPARAPAARGVDRSLGGAPAVTRPRTSSGTSCSAPPATRRSWCG